MKWHRGGIVLSVDDVTEVTMRADDSVTIDKRQNHLCRTRPAVPRNATSY
jgi:hypothetical protein